MWHYFSIFKATLGEGSFDNIIKGRTIQYHHFVKAVDLYVKSVVQWQIVWRETKSSNHRMAERKVSEKLRRFDAIIAFHPTPPHPRFMNENVPLWRHLSLVNTFRYSVFKAPEIS